MLTMAYPKRRLIADCSHLPYTPDDAKRILRTGKLDYVESFPRPENATGFYLADLVGKPILSWPPELPKHDPRGHPSTPKFEAWKKAQDSKIGIAGNYFGFKGGGLTPNHSGLEERCLYHFGMNPFVVEVRAQYPEWERGMYQECKEMNLRMPKRGVITIDFLLTLKMPGGSGFHYHAISVKPYEKLKQLSVQKRHLREVELLHWWGCTHEIMNEHSISIREHINNRRLFEYMKMVNDVSAYQEVASNMATILLSETKFEICDQRVSAAAGYLGLGRDAGYRIFAIANFLGYLTLDHEHEILPDKPLVLVGD
ncbi:TnsA endonuclease N-terminal domain-containing protein [Aquitalea sp. FJL05]|uniref:TnsA endonuclease N-terminal domain-containing protein n=1 Tax=Aquitalea sp. FJL05 TaxID=2153366 RepID=UPI001F2EA6B2|nr:TnsA endonuclease N-terminal domain-containing protein [Aquitalea sp. FJL05]